MNISPYYWVDDHTTKKQWDFRPQHIYECQENPLRILVMGEFTYWTHIVNLEKIKRNCAGISLYYTNYNTHFYEKNFLDSGKWKVTGSKSTILS